MSNDNAFILAVSTGEGISELWLELGADAVLTCKDAGALLDADFRAAILASNARCVLILPNSPSARRVAMRTAALLQGESLDLHILPSESIAEGYALLATMPRVASADELCSVSMLALSAVTSIEIVREPSGELLCKYCAVSRGERYSLAGSAEAALLEVVEKLLLPTHRIITLIVGREVTNARRVFVTERLMELYPDAQIIVYIGGQTASEYYISLR